jgi:hypothetical protein
MKKNKNSMSTGKILIISFAFLLSAFSLSAQTKSSFSGTWNFNESKSQLGDGPGRRAAAKLVITEVENNLIVERTSTRQSGETVVTKEIYNLTGTETDNSTENRKKKSTAGWSADMQQLTVVSTTTFERDGNVMEMKSTEVYSLDSDKKTLTIANTMSSQRGDFKTTLVYDLVK